MLGGRRVPFFLLLLAVLLLTVVLPSATVVRSASLSCTISARVSSETAYFSGSISNYFSPTWTLNYGDGSSDSGSGPAVSGSHTYGAVSTFVVTLVVKDMSPTGGPLSTSCSTSVTTKATFSVDIQEGVKAADAVTYVPPLVVNEGVNVTDKFGSVSPLFVNDSASVAGTPTLTGPGHVGETAKVSEAVTVTKGSGNVFTPLGNPAVLVAFAVTSVAVASILVWRLSFFRAGSGAR
jgi:hypothetical protein